MTWNELSESLALWSSLGVCFALMGIEVFRLRRRIRRTRGHFPGNSSPDNAQQANTQASGSNAGPATDREQRAS